MLLSRAGRKVNVLATRKAPPRPRKKPAPRGAGAREGFGQLEPRRVALYARVSSAQQHTIPMQLRELREYAARRGWSVVLEAHEARSSMRHRPERARLLEAARRRELDAVLVWRLDRWGRSLADLVQSLRELQELGVAFVSLTEAFDLTTSVGRVVAGVLSVFAQFEWELRSERVRAGIEHARREGRHLGRPRSASLKARSVRQLAGKRLRPAAIARELGISRTTVRRILGENQ